MLAENIIILPSSSRAESEVVKNSKCVSHIGVKRGDSWLCLRVENSTQITDLQAKPILRPVPTVSADVPWTESPLFCKGS